MNWEAIFWLVAMVIFIAAEAMTVSLVSIWFAVGALAAMACALCHGPLWLQIGLFVVVSGGCLVFTRKKVQSKFNENRQKTNADRIIGHRGVVLEEIDDQRAVGTVKVDGSIWSARSKSGAVIPKDAEVTILAIEGVKVIVETAEGGVL